MIVTIENKVAKNLITKEEVTFSIWVVYLDGKKIGHIGWADGSKLIYDRKVSPIEERAIKDQLSKLTKQKFTSTPYPSIDPELVAGVGTEEDFYEFDEE